MTELVTTARALADPTRVRILATLRTGELCVCELCDALNVTQSTLSTHLQVIREAGLVTARKDGKWNYYAIAPAARRRVKSWFNSFGAAVAADPALRADARRLRRRLALRDQGSCCVGFTCARPARRRVNP